MYSNSSANGFDDTIAKQYIESLQKLKYFELVKKEFDGYTDDKPPAARKKKLNNSLAQTTATKNENTKKNVRKSSLINISQNDMMDGIKYNKSLDYQSIGLNELDFDSKMAEYFQNLPVRYSAFYFHI